MDLEWMDDIETGISQSFRLIVPRSTNKGDINKISDIILSDFLKSTRRWNQLSQHITDASNAYSENDGIILYLERRTDGTWTMEWGRNREPVQEEIDESTHLEWLWNYREQTFKDTYTVEQFIERT